jgi:hypothetical protein
MLSMIRRNNGQRIQYQCRKNDCHRLDALQNSHENFENGQFRILEPHLVYNQRQTFHVVFLFVVENLVPTITM